MNVSNKIKNAYKQNSITKYLLVSFPDLGLTIDPSKIHSETMNLWESILNSDSIEFVGCIASQFELDIQDLDIDVKDQKIDVSIYTKGTEDEPIPLFHGYVDSAVSQGVSRVKKITAFDILCSIADIDVSNWWNQLYFPLTLRSLRDSFFNLLGIQQKETTLPNDSVYIMKKYNPTSLSAITVMKSICQINGVFGIINRDELFDYKALVQKKRNWGPFPSVTLIPSFFLGSGVRPVTVDGSSPEFFSFYRNLKYEEFDVKPVDKVIIRDNSDDIGVSFGNGTNSYIIQGNILAYGQYNYTKALMAENIYENVHWLSYIPFESNCNGLPFVECGDMVSYHVLDRTPRGRDISSLPLKEKYFYVFNRKLTGIQALNDNYYIEGDQYQSEFITDLDVQLESVKAQTTQYDSRISTVEQQIAQIGTVDKWVSVESVPTYPQANTWYIIRGEVVVN